MTGGEIVAEAKRGRPRGSKNKTKAGINAQAAPKGYDPAADADGGRCSYCGKYFKTKRGNFLTSKSPLYAGNQGYVGMCKGCTERLFNTLTEYFGGDEEKAAERIAQIFDWFWDVSIWNDCKKISANRTKILAYPSKMNLNQHTKDGETYLDTIRLRATDRISTLEDFEDMKGQDKTTVSRAQIQRWGPGFNESEYQLLDNHYKSLKDIIDTNDVVQDSLVRDLCEIKVQQIRARDNDPKAYKDFTALYQDTLKAAKLNVKSAADTTMTDGELCWGNFIRDVERYSPAEIYEDKALFKDVDKIKEYLERFVLRPVRNFFLGTSEMDPEFSIGEANDEDT